ncbi:Sodium:alanine symporter, partial [Rhizophagus irregularis]
MIENIVNWLNGILWGPVMIYGILVGEKSEAGVTSFQALTLALSGRVGTGNIVGTASAIAFGGPGAIFWMWVTAFVGASTAYIESTLAQIYKVKKNG